MILCIDIGNTHIFGGMYHQNKIQFQFRYPSTAPSTSDQLGIFFKSVLRENEVDYQTIKKISICSVVPALDYSIRSAFLKYFSIDPFFLTIDSIKNMKINYKNIYEIGADRLSSALAAIHKFPDKDIIVVDSGTATTFDVITADKSYLGGLIIPGIHISMKALSENTAKLSSVNIVKPKNVLGETTAANIQSGLYYAQLGAAREIINQLSDNVFGKRKPIIIGTGGFSYMFEKEGLFNSIIPELVLDGLCIATSES